MPTAEAGVPRKRILLVWALAMILALGMFVLRMNDRASTMALARSEAMTLAATTAALTGVEVQDLVERLETTATSLLADDVDRDTLVRALPLTGTPVAGILDAATMDLLALTIELDEPVDGQLVLDWVPSLTRAIEGEVAIGELVDLLPEGSIAAVSVPYEANDGRRRVLAAGVLLGDSVFPDILASPVDGTRVEILSRNGRTLLSVGLDADDDAVSEVGQEAPVPGTPWRVRASGPYTAFQPSLGAIWSQPWAIALLLALVFGLMAWWVTRTLRDAATIEEAYGRLAWASRQQREFSALVSHELRTPATSASGLASFLVQQWDRLDEPGRRDLAGRVARSNATLADLVSDLRVSSQLTEGALRFAPAPHRAGDLVHEAVERAGAGASGVQVVGDTETVVLVDGRFASRALSSLVRNAVVHGSEPIQVSVATEGNDVCFAVRDHGSGVPEDFVDVMFEPFTQAQSHLRRSHGGTGLGLHLVRAIAEQLGGRVTHVSADPGAVFLLHLPGHVARRPEPANVGPDETAAA